ncbi:MAG: hypothetical protein PWP71_967 [Clostridia bacterium]|jgi:hypothetical protein|nr:hypothetical protein [Clostridia bacterium]
MYVLHFITSFNNITVPPDMADILTIIPKLTYPVKLYKYQVIPPKKLWVNKPNIPGFNPLIFVFISQMPSIIPKIK